LAAADSQPIQAWKSPLGSGVRRQVVGRRVCGGQHLDAEALEQGPGPEGVLG